MRLRPLLIPVVLCLGVAACAPAPQPARPTPQVPPLTDRLPPMKQFGTPNPLAARRSNDEMSRDFLDLSFMMENGEALPVMSRFEGPITVAIRGPSPPTAEHDLDRVIRRLRNEAKLDISRTTRDTASVAVEFVPVSQLREVAPTAACFVVPRVTSFADYRAHLRGPEPDWTTLTQRKNVAVFIPADESPQEIRDCLNEELAQAVGPLNDLYRIPDTVFNDDNFHNILTGFDMLMLRAYYAPELHSGTTREQAAAIVPTLLQRYNPKGSYSAALPDPETPRAWIRAIETSFGPGTADSRRITAAKHALQIATKNGWTDTRMGFSQFAVARLSLDGDVGQALDAYLNAARIFRTLPDADIHASHVDMQMAAFALSSGQADAALMLTDVAIPAARKSENASLLATLLMIRSEALRLSGDKSGAAAARRESLGWGRYGYKNDAELRSRLAEVQALSPDRGL
ncbi:DUF2927 domain-containing protein [Falsirhodobacter sp. alg1]|uniref:DUF2927 domain-containing protein n=1 Tax=Falsirhodobacter sp. alg1 TaxID=1472418 RepID=UPI0005F082EC|nr:DUF2927 domain-containing protein [Falsirhodobacter sp. alg1]